MEEYITVGELSGYGDDYEVWDEERGQWVDVSKASYLKGGGFPDPEIADSVINLIVCYNSFDKIYHIFGLKNYHTPKDNVKYYWCKSEEDLLKSFVKHFQKEGYDVLTGWNSNSYDVPSIINRITFQIGKEWADKLSPIGRIYEKTNPTGKFGMPSKEYVIEGVSCLDYYVMYQKFNLEKQENYKLDNIGEVELGINKISHDGNLWELAKNDWYTYVDYCIRDVEILVKLDEKKGYINLLRFLAYTGLCDLENAIKTLPPMNGAIAIRARMRGEYIPTFIRPVTDYKAPGGYVAEPKVGFAENIVSFDANSLYPSVMISLNLSPETKIGRVEKDGDKIKIHHVSGRLFEMTKENFKKFIDEEKAALTKAGFLFSQKKRGLVPEFLDNLYSKRKEMKNKMLECRKNGDKEGEQKFDSIQYAYKIHLNSLYGYMLNKYAPLGDEDIGTSVTLTGQAVIKKSKDVFCEYMREILPDISESLLQQSYIYSDTDSVAGDTLITTDNGCIKIEDMWSELYDENNITLSSKGHEILNNVDLNISTYNPDSKEQIMAPCSQMFRHRVSKRRFKIKYGDKNVVITEDHGLMVYRNGDFMCISPLEYKKGDKMVIEKR